MLQFENSYNGSTKKKKKKKLPADTSQILPTLSNNKNPYGVKGFAKTPPTTNDTSFAKTATVNDSGFTKSVPKLPSVQTKERKTVGNSIVESNGKGGWTVVGQVEQPKQETSVMSNVQTTTPTTPTQTTTQPNLQDLEAQKRAMQLQNMKDAFNRAFQNTQSQINLQQEQLTPRFRDERSQIGVQDVMARTGAEKIQATQGLSGAGARTQSDIAQNILTQGAMGQSRLAESEQRAALDRQLVEAQQARDLGIAEAEAGASMAELQGQIDAETARVANELKQQEIQSERDYEIYKLQLEETNERERLVLENELEREITLLDAEIENARDNNLFEQERQLIAQKNANELKLEAVKQANEMAQISARGANEREAIALRNQAEGTTQQFYDDSVINSAVSNFVSGVSDKKSGVASWLVQNASVISDQQGDNIMRKYNLTLQDVQDMQAKIYNVSPSIGM